VGRALFSGRLSGAGRVSGRAALFSGRFVGVGRAVLFSGWFSLFAETFTGLAGTELRRKSFTEAAGLATAAVVGVP